MRPKQRAALRKLFSLPQTPVPLDKNKNLLREIYTEMYRHFAFKVLQESSSWVSRNGAVQMFFSDIKQKHVCKRVEIPKMSELFWAKLYCKMSDLFRWFLLALRFSATNSGTKKTLMVSTGTCGLKLYARNNIFKKRITSMRFWIIYILVQVSFFVELL